MAPYRWQTDPVATAQTVEQRGVATGDASRLIVWAGFSVDALHYLADADDLVVAKHPQRWLGHPPETVDLAHVSAVAATAFAAYDRCAAALGRMYLHGGHARFETALSELRPWSRNKKIENARAQLPSPARAWIRQVWTDPSYKTLRGFRHPLTHATITRSLSRPLPAGHASRMRLSRYTSRVTPKVGSRDFILTCRDSTTSQIEAFLALVKRGAI